MRNRVINFALFYRKSCRISHRKHTRFRLVLWYILSHWPAFLRLVYSMCSSNKSRAHYAHIINSFTIFLKYRATIDAKKKQEDRQWKAHIVNLQRPNPFDAGVSPLKSVKREQYTYAKSLWHKYTLCPLLWIKIKKRTYCKSTSHSKNNLSVIIRLARARYKSIVTLMLQNLWTEIHSNEWLETHQLQYKIDFLISKISRWII